MNDAEIATADQPRPIPNYLVTAGTLNHNGTTIPTREVRFGEPARSITVRDIDVGDQFDIAEISADDTSQTWTAMALLAKSVLSIDGMPIPSLATKSQIRDVLVRVGNDGLSAITRAAAPPMEAGAVEASTKN